MQIALCCPGFDLTVTQNDNELLNAVSVAVDERQARSVTPGNDRNTAPAGTSRRRMAPKKRRV
jgi:hypothetical protein